MQDNSLKSVVTMWIEGIRSGSYIITGIPSEYELGVRWIEANFRQVSFNKYLL